MDALVMATGNLPAARAGLGSMTYPPRIAAVRQARRYVQDAVATSATPALADDAAQLVAELAVNAVLHARTDFDVAVDSTEDGVRVSVRDRSTAMPSLVAPSGTRMSGRGLALVEAVASRWGAGPSASAPKSVWFELSGQRTGPVDGDDDGDDVGACASSSCTDGDAVVLPALDTADLLGAEEAMEDVLRELQLLLLSSVDGSGPALDTGSDGAAPWTGQETEVAYRLDRAARDFAHVRAQVREQVSCAAASGQPLVALRLSLEPGEARRASAYAAALEAAEELAAGGGLLGVADALARHRAYLLEVVAAASWL